MAPNLFSLQSSTTHRDLIDPENDFSENQLVVVGKHSMTG
jgi:hypothetical protein